VLSDKTVENGKSTSKDSCNLDEKPDELIEEEVKVSYSYIRKLDEPSIRDFNIKLSYELWEDIFGEKM
jgi:hypothetical protein